MARLQRTGKTELIRTACTAVAQGLRSRRDPRQPSQWSIKLRAARIREARHRLYDWISRRLRTREDFEIATEDLKHTKKLARWMKRIRRLREFNLAAELTAG